MKKICLFLLTLLMMIPFTLNASTVNDLEEYFDAMGDSDVTEVKLGSNITITEDDVVAKEYDVLIGSNKTLDLNGHILKHTGYVDAEITFNLANGIFTITNTDGNGKINSYSNFGEVNSEVTGCEIHFDTFKYESMTNSSMLINSATKKVKLTVDNVDFYYPSNAPLSSGFNLTINSLTVTATTDNPVGFYNDSAYIKVSEVVNPKSYIKIDGELFKGDREEEAARNLYLEDHINGKIIIDEGYQLTFHSNGGTNIGSYIVPKNVEFNTVKPEDPKYGELELYSWYSDEELTQFFSGNRTIDKDYDLYARYGKKFLLMTYNYTNSEIYTGGKLRSQTNYISTNAGGFALDDSPATYTAVPDYGYIFKGWAMNNESGIIVSTNPEITFSYDGGYYGTFYALFERGAIVKFDSKGGSAIEERVLKHGSPLGALEIPEREGYVFDGWYTSEDYEQQVFAETEIVKDEIYYAKWKKIIYNVDCIFDTPQSGLKPNFNIEVLDSSKYYISSFTIQEIAEGYPTLDENSVFELGHEYTYRIVFAPQEGYVFTDDTEFLLNGEDSDSYGANHFRQKTYTAVLPQIKVAYIKIKSDANTITLDWNQDVAATKYIIYRSNDGKKYSKYKTITENTYKDKDLTYGKTYYYKIKVCDDSKCTGYSNVVSKKIKPNKVVLSIKSAGTNNIKLSWERVKVTGYEISRSTDNKTWTKIKTITDSKTLEFNNKDLKANKTYYYKVRAYKTVSGTKVYGSWSDVVSTKTAPVKPTFEVKLKDYNAMNLIIGSSKGAVKYVVQKSLDGKTYTLVENLPNAGTLAQEDLEVGKTYYYALKACNSQNRCSGWVKVSLKQTPKTPKLTLRAGSKKVTITVGSVNGADGYRVYRSTSKNGKYELIKEILNGEEMTFNNKTKKGVTYYYKVRSYRKVDSKNIYSPYSKVKSIKSK